MNALDTLNYIKEKYHLKEVWQLTQPYILEAMELYKNPKEIYITTSEHPFLKENLIIEEIDEGIFGIFTQNKEIWQGFEYEESEIFDDLEMNYLKKL